MSHSLLIDIEGADGSGKATQTRLLLSRLEKEGKKTATFSFPQYTLSRAGKLTGELLAGKHGDFMSTPAYVSALPYAIDRGSAAGKIRDALQEGKVVVCDRYTPSNLAHQSAKLPKDEQDALVEFIEGLEYEDLGAPRPDIVIYLSVPTDVSSELIAGKGKRAYLDGEARDLAERNIAHQDRTRAAYLRLAREKGWYVIECIRDGALRTPEDIHEDIWNIASTRLK